MNAVAPTILLALAGIGFASGGRFVPGAIGFVGLLLALVALFDYPVTVLFGPEGVERRCLLRRVSLSWDEVGAIGRPRKTQDRSLQRLGGLAGRVTHGESTLGSPSSGLVAEVNRRPHLLTDRIESTQEFEALRAGLVVWGSGVAIRASEPAAEIAATFSYKKRAGDGKDPLVDWV